jgi:hypothetical protein
VRSNGVIETNFDAQLEPASVVFALATQSDGRILVGGSFAPRLGVWGPLARMTSTFEWDATYSNDTFDPGFANGWIAAISPQADGSVVLSGKFFEVGGYWRRHLVRLDSQGHVDGCFNSGLGLGGFDGARTLAQHSNGRFIVGGSFQGVDSHPQPSNLAAIVAQDDCSPIRVYLLHQPGYVVGIYPPGGTNYLQMSTNLMDWTTVDTQTGNSVFWAYDSVYRPTAFFRIKKVY